MLRAGTPPRSVSTFGFVVRDLTQEPMNRRLGPASHCLALVSCRSYQYESPHIPAMTPRAARPDSPATARSRPRPWRLAGSTEKPLRGTRQRHWSRRATLRIAYARTLRMSRPRRRPAGPPAHDQLQDAGALACLQSRTARAGRRRSTRTAAPPPIEGASHISTRTPCCEPCADAAR